MSAKKRLTDGVVDLAIKKLGEAGNKLLDRTRISTARKLDDMLGEKKIRKTI